MGAQLKLIYPESPGFKKPGTSERAARTIAPHIHTLHLQCLEVLCHYEMTPIEIADALRKKADNVKPRCSQLKALGYVEETGIERYDSHSKFPKEVLRATEKGRELIRCWKAGALFVWDSNQKS